MLPNSRRKRFVPPMKGSQTNDNDSISSSQISQITQSSCYSLNNITFFSESLKATNTDNVLSMVNNDTTLVENSDKMDDSLELLQDNNNTKSLTTLEPCGLLDNDFPLDCPPDYPITQQEHYSVPPLKHSTTTNTNIVTNTTNITTKRATSNILYKFPVGNRNITKKCTNYKNSNSHKRQRSTTSVSECIETTTDITVYDFPVSQTGSPIIHKKGRHSNQQDTTATTVCNNNSNGDGNGNDSIDTSTTSLRTHKEQAMINNDVMGIITQTRKDIINIKQRYKEHINNKQLINKITHLLVHGNEQYKADKPKYNLSFFIAEHED